MIKLAKRKGTEKRVRVTTSIDVTTVSCLRNLSKESGFSISALVESFIIFGINKFNDGGANDA